MTEAFIIELMQSTLYTITLISLPPIAAILIIGLLTNIAQTITQMKDQALSFVPKIIIVAIVLVIAIPFYIQIMENYTHAIFNLIGRGAS